MAYESVKRARALKDKIVLIIGAGTIGICMLQLQAPKMLIVSDLSDARLERAKALGADAVINPKKGIS